MNGLLCCLFSLSFPAVTSRFLLAFDFLRIKPNTAPAKTKSTTAPITPPQRFPFCSDLRIEEVWGVPPAANVDSTSGVLFGILLSGLVGESPEGRKYCSLSLCKRSPFFLLQLTHQIWLKTEKKSSRIRVMASIDHKPLVSISQWMDGWLSSDLDKKGVVTLTLFFFACLTSYFQPDDMDEIGHWHISQRAGQ